mmetsp:Transcript_54812/g.155283  ORF Transcript_54812/g.155283 Transcript_54812/m.155283 type:complete len:262 (-) Transcript_54812:73-858(-)
MVKLVALRGDPELEALLSEKHKELLSCAVPLDASTGLPPSASDGTTLDEAREAWFLRKVGQQGDSRERRKLMKMLLKALRKFAEKYEKPPNAEGALSAMEALKEGGPTEGPLICHRLEAGLAGTRFEGLRIAKKRDGVYQLGPKLLVAVQADLEGGALLVHGYFDDSGVLHPVRVPVLAFLEEHGAKPPSDDCDLFGGGGGGGGGEKRSAAVSGASGGEEGSKRQRELPPGWTKRESRSKKGVFYYVHEAKGLSQFDRPES